MQSNLVQSITSFYSEIYSAVLHLMHLRLYTEACLKYISSDYHTILVIPEEGKESKVVSAMLKKENADADEQTSGWYGTKEEIKDSDDFFPFVMIKLGVPTTLKD